MKFYDFQEHLFMRIVQILAFLFFHGFIFKLTIYQLNKHELLRFIARKLKEN